MKFEILKNFFTIIGGISTIIGLPIVITKLKETLKKPKQKLGFSCVGTYIIESSCDCKYSTTHNYLSKKYKLKIETTSTYSNNETETNVEDIENLYSLQLEFKNIGTKIIKGNDFYKNEQLGFNVETGFICASIRNETPKYINPKINIDNGVVNISFDSIKPNDSIFISILYNKKPFIIRNFVSGKTEDIDNIYPINTKTIKFLSLFSENEDIMYIKEGLNILFKSYTFRAILFFILFITFIIIFTLFFIFFILKFNQNVL